MRRLGSCSEGSASWVFPAEPRASFLSVGAVSCLVSVGCPSPVPQWPRGCSCLLASASDYYKFCTENIYFFVYQTFTEHLPYILCLRFGSKDEEQLSLSSKHPQDLKETITEVRPCAIRSFVIKACDGSTARRTCG